MNEPISWTSKTQIVSKIKIYSLTRAELLCSLCHEIPCTSENLHDINDVLKRKCVIWDNEHANDYDQKRVFLGPYSGRSPEVKSKLAGVMTNPNCEYGANFIAIHTLAQWSKCSVDGTLPTASSDTVSCKNFFGLHKGPSI